MLLKDIRYRRELPTYFLEHFVVLLMDVLQKEIFICTLTWNWLSNILQILFSIERTNMIHPNHAKLQVPQEKRSKHLYLIALFQVKNMIKIFANLTTVILMQVIFVTLGIAKTYTNKLNTKLTNKAETREYVFKYSEAKRKIFETVWMSKRGLFNTLVQSHFLLVFGMRRTLTFFMKMQQSMLLGWRHWYCCFESGW